MEILKATKARHLVAIIKAKTRERLGKTEYIDLSYKLPLELILMIVEYLPLQSQIVASQVCRGMREYSGHLHNKTKLLSREEYLEFLACLARDLPDKWLALKYNRLEKISKQHKMYLKELMRPYRKLHPSVFDIDSESVEHWAYPKIDPRGPLSAQTG
ncbi:hypothetical protein G7Z17_g4995 [Cylindrodendrum hubeiense]|uniref:F-box domain-containing protein n=1 Tax=Cylindrodendrum hubeiense TaxID=595255 RepID=A0A9P5HD03_9HYPO|nr:hypothetical protein G7Z17_g4995 [Cylindrodendrum hubeiense]